MAFITMDFVGPLMSNYMRNVGLYNKFVSAWGQSDGLYNERLYFYQGGQVNLSAYAERFLNALGVRKTDLESNDYDEIEAAWFYFNPYKVRPGTTTPVTTAQLSTKLNEFLPVGSKMVVRLTYAGPTQLTTNGSTDEFAIDVKIITTTANNFSEMLHNALDGDRFATIAGISEVEQRAEPYYQTDNIFIDNETENWSRESGTNINTFGGHPFVTSVLPADEDSTEDNIEMFSLALLDKHNSVFGVTKDEDGKPKVIRSGYVSYIGEAKTNITFLEEDVDCSVYPDYCEKYPNFTKKGDLKIAPFDGEEEVYKQGASKGYYEEYEYTFNGSTEDSQLILDILDAINKTYEISIINSSFIPNTMQKKAIKDLHKASMSLVNADEHEYWGYLFKGNRLKVEEAKQLKKYEFAQMVGECLDTDFKIEEASFLEKLIAVVVAIVAVVLVVITYGALAPSLGTLAALSIGLGYASLTLSIGVLVLSAMGPSALGLVRMIGGVAQIVGIVASITGLIAAAQAAFNRMAEQAVKEGAIQQTSDYTIGMMAKDLVSDFADRMASGFIESIDTVLDVVTDPFGSLFGGSSPVSDTGLGGWFNRLEKGMSAYMKFTSSSNSQAPSEPQEEQLERDAFKYPEDMYTLQEQTIYETDALEKIDIIKDNSFGGAITQRFFERIY